jgi:hypothetical protein
MADKNDRFNKVLYVYTQQTAKCSQYICVSHSVPYL